MDPARGCAQELGRSFTKGDAEVQVGVTEGCRDFRGVGRG